MMGLETLSTSVELIAIHQSAFSLVAACLSWVGWSMNPPQRLTQGS